MTTRCCCRTQSLSGGEQHPSQTVVQRAAGGGPKHVYVAHRRIAVLGGGSAVLCGGDRIRGHFTGNKIPYHRETTAVDNKKGRAIDTEVRSGFK